MATTTSSSLGTLSRIPPELRDRIYAHVLNFDSASYTDSILTVSKQIYAETKIVFFETNEFNLWIDHDFPNHRTNRSVEGWAGWRLNIRHCNTTKASGEAAFYRIPPFDMIPIMQKIHLSIGGAGISEEDIEPRKHQMCFGPERPTYTTLMETVQRACELLKQCRHIHLLRLSIRSIEKEPGNIEMVLDPIRSLRGIKQCKAVIWSMQEDMWVDWNLRGSYGRYLNEIMALPYGAETPKYIGDETDPNQSEDNIFHKIGGTWMGGTKFALPGDSDFDDEEDGFYTGYDEYDDFEDYEAELEDSNYDDGGYWLNRGEEEYDYTQLEEELD